MPTSSFPSRFPLALLSLGLLGALCGCGSSSSDDDFEVRTAPLSASSTAEIAVGGVWMVYLASEAFTGPPPGTHLNGDTDFDDEVAVAVDMSTDTATELGVAAERAVIVGGQVFLVVREAEDDIDWNGNLSVDTVLLHWTGTGTAMDVVDTLDPAGAQRLFVVEDRLYYRSDAAPGLGDDSTLRQVSAANPTAKVTIAGQAGLGLTDPEILGQDAGLLFLALDETGGADLNNDTDALDTHVLALLDGTDPAALIQNAEVALEDTAAPIDAFLRSEGDWLIACLVDEAPLNADGQSRANGLNDQALFPLNQLDACATNDTDTSDQVLHYLTFLGTPAVPTTAVNTGIAGHDRVLAFTGFVATVCAEADAGCDLNADLDVQDDVARWCATTGPAAPVIDTDLMHALESSVPGGSFGLSRLDNRLVAVVDEADDKQNLDGKAADHDLVGWIEPALASPEWHFSHQSSSEPSFGTGVFDSDHHPEPFAGTSWLAAEPVGDRLGVTFLEEVPGTNTKVGSLNTNLNCNLFAKDTDKIDALPVWADFEGDVLDFDGVGYSVVTTNPGIVIAAGFAFFRVSEAEDNHDHDGDGVLDDVVLFNNPLTSCRPVAMATSSPQIGPVITTDFQNGAAFLSIEGGNLVVKYFLF